MIYSSEFRLDRNKKEIFPSYSDDFPYVCMKASLNYFIGRGWHWHPAFEIDYVLDGSLNLQTPDGRITLTKGDAIFINSNVTHDAHAADKDKNCEIYAILFGAPFLSGMYGSIYERKYIFPILNCRELSAFKIQPDSPQSIHIIESFLKAVELTDREPFGYEFEVRSEISRLWCLLLEATARVRGSQNAKTSADSERLKDMLQYIHDHYMDKIAIRHIADAAHISDRECSRCFQRCLNTSPVSYLNDYRITMAAKLLLHTDDSILSVCSACGFSSNSYFGKLFRHTMGCTPREYRASASRQDYFIS